MFLSQAGRSKVVATVEVDVLEVEGLPPFVSLQHVRGPRYS